MTRFITFIIIHCILVVVGVLWSENSRVFLFCCEIGGLRSSARVFYSNKI